MEVQLKYGTARTRILTVQDTAVAVYGMVDSPKATTLASQVNEENGKNEDAHAWRFLRRVVQTLGSDDMSSD
jgi:hypothetical protein